MFSIATLTACTGNSSSNRSTLPEGSIAIKKSITTIDDVIVNQRTYDRDLDDYLTPTEQQEMKAAIARAKLKQVTASAITTNMADPIITRLSVTGNAEINDGMAQIHPSQSLGNFGITLAANVTTNQTTDIRIELGNKPANERSGNASTSLRLTDLPEGNNIIALLCEYHNNLTFNCVNAFYFVDDNAPTILSPSLNSTNGENFETNSLPQAGYVIATTCQNNICFNNTAQVPVSFN